MARKSKGRQKVEMMKMSKESNLQVTFSKRRSGLFKKASELCTLCGAEIAIIVFSPGKKAFSFGHPCVESIMDRFLTRNPLPTSSSGANTQLIEAHRSASVRQLNVELTNVTNKLEAEKKSGEVLNQMRKAGQTQNWWEGPIDALGLQDLEQLKEALEELKKSVAKQLDNKALIQASSSSPALFGTSTSSSLIGGANVPFQYSKSPPSFGVDFKIPQASNSFDADIKMPRGFNPNYGRGFF